MKGIKKMATQVFYETTSRCARKTEPRHIAKFLQEKFAEEQKKNPRCIGGTYSNGRILFRYAPAPEKKANHDLELLKIKWLKLWWAKNGATQEKRTAQDLEWEKTKTWLRKQGIF